MGVSKSATIICYMEAAMIFFGILNQFFRKFSGPTVSDKTHLAKVEGPAPTIPGVGIWV
jgi:hypothetical protein